MTITKRLFATAAAAAMLTTTTAAVAAAPTTGVSAQAPARAGSPSDHASDLGADVPTTTLISIGVLAALVAIVLIATKGDNNDSPNSP